MARDPAQACALDCEHVTYKHATRHAFQVAHRRATFDPNSDSLLLHRRVSIAMPSTSSTRGVFHGLTLAPFKQSFKQLVPLGQPSRGLNVLANFVSVSFSKNLSLSSTGFCTIVSATDYVQAHGGGFSFVVDAATHLVFPHEVTQQRVRVTNGARGGNEGWLEALIRQYGWLEGPDGEAQPPRSDKVVLVTDKWVRDCVESGELLSTRCLVRCGQQWVVELGRGGQSATRAQVFERDHGRLGVLEGCGKGGQDPKGSG